MGGTKLTTSDKPYLRIVGGNFVQKVAEGTPDARVRKWKSPDGGEGETIEVAYMNWTALVLSVEVKENDYGEVCIIELEDAQITLNTSSRYFSDFASKIHNADLSQPITLHPYDMEIDGKKKSGISMWQGDDKDRKLQNHYYDGSKNINGMPEVDPDAKKTKTYWKKYFLEVGEFLAEKLNDLEFPEVAPVPETVDEFITDISKGDADAFEEFIAEEPAK